MARFTHGPQSAGTTGATRRRRGGRRGKRRSTVLRYLATIVCLGLGTSVLPGPAPVGASPTYWAAVAVGDAWVNEGNAGTRTATFPVTLSRTTSVTFTVDYTIRATTASGAVPATPGSDFKDKAGKTLTLTFKPGQRVKYVNVAVLSDAVEEPEEVFEVALSNPNPESNGYSLTGFYPQPAVGYGRILDDDAVGSPTGLRLSHTTIVEADSTLPTVAKVWVTLSAPAVSPVTVDYATSSSSPLTASAGSDYVARSGSLTFKAGQWKKPVPVKVLADATSEERELLAVVLTGASGAPIVQTHGLVLIQDNDHDVFLWDYGQFASDGTESERGNLTRFAAAADDALLTRELLATREGFGCVVVPAGDIDPEFFATIESWLDEYVDGGGTLVLIGEDENSASANADMNALSLAIDPAAGMSISASPGSHDGAAWSSTENVTLDALTAGVVSLRYRSAGEMTITGNATTLVATVAGVPFVAAGTVNANGGRVVMTSDIDWIGDRDGGEAYAPGDDNHNLARNLCGA